ncbi:MAG: type II toxin-antitoxin system VapC family toxin [Ignisphaera sp.]|nr:type II toxin-antitoxin system VapC family toxin [Ignisphaera sp.]MCC6056176.1 type II toxin-antitoxin system VapC family toxin [Desulfurococcaceae archaeon]
MIVIDASALAKFIFKEEGWERVYKILSTRVISVDHIVKEVANAIWKHSSIHKTYLDVALKEFQLLKKIIDEKLVLLESELKYLDKAFEIAIQNSIPVYDALYIAQAITHNIPLATSDKRQAEIAEKLKVQVVFIP